LPSTTIVLAIAMMHWLEYVGLMGAIGSMVVRRLAANRPRIGWARPPMHLALAAALIGGIGVVNAEALVASGSLPGAVDYLATGPSGWVRIGRVVAEGVALVLCMRGMRMVAPFAIFAAASLAFAGHAAAVSPAAGAIFTDALHVLSASAWAGGIIVLATLRPPDGWSGAEGRALLVRFGRVAVLAFATTALTGVLRATAAIGVVSDLWGTPYGLVLSAKSVGVLLMLVLSAVAFRRRLAFTRIEATVAVAVLGATGLLAAYPLPSPGVDGMILLGLGR
jgi:putative copper export protein